jgi:hypothetical protein
VNTSHLSPCILGMIHTKLRAFPGPLDLYSSRPCNARAHTETNKVAASLSHEKLMDFDGTLAASLSESSCLLHGSRTNIYKGGPIIVMIISSPLSVRLSAASLRAHASHRRRAPVALREFAGFSPLAARPAVPTAKGWMRPAASFASWPSSFSHLGH